MDINAVEWVYHDGGREAAGFKKLGSSTRDCGTRAIAIAEGMSYQEAYDLIKKYAAKERLTKKMRKRSHPNNGIYTKTMHRILTDLGYDWVSTCRFGIGVMMHLNRDELPKSGILILRLSKHYAAYVDGVYYDTFVDDREGQRAVYGYWIKG